MLYYTNYLTLRKTTFRWHHHYMLFSLNDIVSCSAYYQFYNMHINNIS